MKERPILFSAPMVNAILDGKKTQTRRVIKGHWKEWLESINDITNLDASCALENQCPHGKIGDQLWVRESFWQWGKYRTTGKLTEKGKPEIKFCPIGKNVIFKKPEVKPTSRFEIGYHKRPSIFIPRWASRIQLEITDIRVERLRDIVHNPNDAVAEGCPDSEIGFQLTWFSKLWKSINGAESWDSNPWVWVIEFERIKP